MFNSNYFYGLCLGLSCLIVFQVATAAPATCSTSICTGTGQTCTISDSIDFYTVADAETCVLDFGSRNVQITGRLSNQAPLSDEFYWGTLSIRTQGNILVTGTVTAGTLELKAGGILSLDADRGVGRLYSRDGSILLDAGLGLELTKGSQLIADDSDEIVLAGGNGGVQLAGSIQCGGERASVEISAARDISLSSTGSIWAGDDSIDDSDKSGGSISIDSSGAVLIAGTVSANAKDSGGEIEINAVRNLSIAAGAKIFSFAQKGEEDQGELSLNSLNGAALIGGEIKVGGDTIVSANGDLSLVKGSKIDSLTPGKIELTSLAGKLLVAGLLRASTPETGGEINLSAKREVRLESDGELVAIASPSPSGSKDDWFSPGGGAVEVLSETASVSLAGSIRVSGPETGGTIGVYAPQGDITVGGLLEANATAKSVDTAAGSINFRDKDGRRQGAEGDVTIGPDASLKASAVTGLGGSIDISYACDLKIDGLLDVSGGNSARGGDLAIEYRRSLQLGSALLLTKAGTAEDDLWLWCREAPGSPGTCASYPVDASTGKSLRMALPILIEKMTECGVTAAPSLPPPFMNDTVLACDDGDFCTQDYRETFGSCKHSAFDTLRTPDYAACNVWNSRARIGGTSCRGSCNRELQKIDQALKKIAQRFSAGNTKQQHCKSLKKAVTQLVSYGKYLSKRRVENQLSRTDALDYLRAQSLEALSRAGSLKSKYCGN